MGTTFDPAKTTFQTVVYRQYTRELGAGSCQTSRGTRASRGRDPCAGRRHDPRPLREPRHGLSTGRTRCTSTGSHYSPGSDGAYIPGFSGPGADVQPGKTFTYRLVAGPDSVGVWPYHDHSPSMDESIAGGLYGALSIVAPGERLPDHEFVVLPRADARLHDDRRPGVRRQHARVPRARSATSSSGTCSRSATTSTPSTSTATAGRRRTAPTWTRRRSGRPRASRSSGARTPRHVALPLPRRGPHEQRDDRALPGVAMRLRSLAAVGVVAGAGGRDPGRARRRRPGARGLDPRQGVRARTRSRCSSATPSSGGTATRPTTR